MDFKKIMDWKYSTRTFPDILNISLAFFSIDISWHFLTFLEMSKPEIEVWTFPPQKRSKSVENVLFLGLSEPFKLISKNSQLKGYSEKLKNHWYWKTRKVSIATLRRNKQWQQWRQWGWKLREQSLRCWNEKYRRPKLAGSEPLKK